MDKFELIFVIIQTLSFSFVFNLQVRQTMLFHAFLREPGTHTRARDTKGRINALGKGQI